MKHYIRKTDLVYVGRHGAQPKGTIEIPESLVGKSVKIVQVVDDMDIPIDTVVLDEALDAQRVSNEAQAAEDQKWSELRANRNGLLAECDHHMLHDSTSKDSQEIKDYRQALRDLPSNVSDIDNVEFPTKPEGL